MKRVIFILLVSITLTACQDVVDIDVPIDSPRLVIDALIRVDESEADTKIQVKASISSSFFGTLVPANLERITLTNESGGAPLVLTETGSGTGIYQTYANLEFLKFGTLQLSILHDGQSYSARTKYVPSSPIDRLEQGDGTLFDGTETEIIVVFTDAPDRTDFYLFDFDFGEYLVSEDTFYPGQPFKFSYFYDEELKPSMEVNVSILGVDKTFYNYMNQLIAQSSSGDQGPFQTPAATVKGNIINVTEINTAAENNYALGYFAVCQSFERSLIIE
ncbi:DUF4249 family protein [uncultured Kriegella sp.]|uniref:DUF4249 family protein n=1 Tax=uncultured Kriegella sp. TaxID=1798910 RepID=UPI0030D88286|tara:strand:+ start:406887 stop:407711 length:825 start_codon:yes stop_codon:yes gene_type:complete